jgi:hypothetical protein
MDTPYYKMRRSCGSKYADVPTNNISEWSISMSRIIFTWRADIEHIEVSDITNNFQKLSTKFITKLNMNKGIYVMFTLVLNSEFRYSKRKKKLH